MRKQIDLFPRSVLKALAVYGILHILFAFILPAHMTGGWIAGYLLGLLAVLLHFAASVFTGKSSDDRFFRIFFLSLVIRFLLILVLFVILVLSEKFEQLSFTVGFLISYIFHSVNDVILLNNKLTNHSG
jgi:hypothetical protein